MFSNSERFFSLMWRLTFFIVCFMFILIPYIIFIIKTTIYSLYKINLIIYKVNSFVFVLIIKLLKKVKIVGIGGSRNLFYINVQWRTWFYSE